LPLLHDDKYIKFSALYGKGVDEKDCPSTKPISIVAEVEKRRKTILISRKVRCIMNCQECFKPRCAYSKAKLSKLEEIALKRVQESRLYTCSASLFLPSSEYYDTVCDKESLVCGDPIELSYFSAALVCFPLVCYW